MRRTVFASVAILALLVSFAGPVNANGVAHGKKLSVALQGLPDTCPTGVAMTGAFLIQLADNGVRGKQAVTVNVTVETPFGDVAVFNATFRMENGSKREIPLNIPVGAQVPPGDYHFDVAVAVKGESLTVGHDVMIFNGK